MLHHQSLMPELLADEDPLGDLFLESVSPRDRRAQGATFTPAWLVDLQLDQIAATAVPARVLDAGAGTGRYALAAARRWPFARVIAVEKDAALAAAIRINAKQARLEIQVVCGNYLEFALDEIAGATAFVGNPPYVRHHDISPEEKAWYSAQMRLLGLPHSQLAGLHIYFFLKSYLLSKPDDLGCFVTAAEWMETNYGESMRRLFCLLGGRKLIRVHPAEKIFHDALTTSVITTWSVGSKSTVSIEDLGSRAVEPKFKTTFEDLLALSKWPGYGRSLPSPINGGAILKDYFRVSRGQVTGLNEIWIATRETQKLIPGRYLFPCVTDARDVINADRTLHDASKLRRVIDLPADLAELTSPERKNVDLFLATAVKAGAADTYIAKHRKPWWRVGLKAPPPIIMSYMGRRPPSFARNACGARLINIAHGLTPLRPLGVRSQDRWVAWLNQNVRLTGGRTYGGGMVKFEPGDAMQIPLPAEAARF